MSEPHCFLFAVCLEIGVSGATWCELGLLTTASGKGRRRDDSAEARSKSAVVLLHFGHGARCMRSFLPGI